MKNVLIRIILSSLFFILGIAPVVAGELKLGVVAPRGEAQAAGRWNELGKYLSAQIGETVKVVPMHASKIPDGASNGSIDLLLSHSAHTVFVKEKLGAMVLATINGKAGSLFGGVIVAKKGKGITTAADLKGKNVMSLKFKTSAGAYIFQTHYLMKQGINPHKDFASLREGKKQDDLILAVQGELIDAAFVRTGMLEAMAREGKIKMDDFVVVDAKNVANFPYALTTGLYPDWCLSAMPNVPADVAKKIKAALLTLPADSTAAKNGKIKGFIEPLPLDEVEDALKKLHIAPYSA